MQICGIFVRWARHYHIEIAVSIMGYAMVAQLASILKGVEVVGRGGFTQYESIMLMLMMALMIIATVIMINVARTRVSTAEVLLDKLSSQ